MARSTAMDLTTGRPIKQIVLFSIPLILGSLFQQLYSFVDTVMVGRLIGESALAGVGAASGIQFLIVGFINGSCVGFSIPLAKAVGAKDRAEFHRWFWNGCWVCLLTALVLTVGMLALTEPLLRLVNTPDDIFYLSSGYIRTIFLGIGATFLYNFCAGVLRSTGDSTRPTMFLLISSFVNIALDYVFIAHFDLGVQGAALATVLSQLLSGLLNLFWLVFRTDCLSGSAPFRRPDPERMISMVRVGYPMGFNLTLAALGIVVIQGVLNALGTAAITGQTAGEKVRQMFTVPMESIGMGIATYAGQNDGAGRPDRIRQGIFAGLTVQLSYCAVSWIVIFLGKGAFTELILGTQTSEAAAYAMEYLGIMSSLFCFHGSLMVMRNTLQGMGYSGHSVFSGVTELVGRSLAGILAARWLGFFGICIAAPMAWGSALVYCAIMVRKFLGQRLKL